MEPGKRCAMWLAGWTEDGLRCVSGRAGAETVLCACVRACERCCCCCCCDGAGEMRVRDCGGEETWEL